MENVSLFDIILLALVAFLGLKGLLRGFIKELFGLIGIVGGVYIASRLSHDVGYMLTSVVPIESDSTKALVGFVVAFIAFWALTYFLGIVVAKISSMSGLGIFDRVLGFIFGAGKIFLIFAIIIYALSKVEAIKTKLDKKLESSTMYPILQEIGGEIIKLDTAGITKKIEENIEETTKNISTEIIAEEVKKQVEKMGEK